MQSADSLNQLWLNVRWSIYRQIRSQTVKMSVFLEINVTAGHRPVSGDHFFQLTIGGKYDRQTISLNVTKA